MDVFKCICSAIIGTSHTSENRRDLAKEIFDEFEERGQDEDFLKAFCMDCPFRASSRLLEVIAQNIDQEYSALVYGSLPLLAAKLFAQGVSKEAIEQLESDHTTSGQLHPVTLFHAYNRMLESCERFKYAPLSGAKDGEIMFTEEILVQLAPKKSSLRKSLGKISNYQKGFLSKFLFETLLRPRAVKPVLASDWSEGDRFIWGTSFRTNGYSVHYMYADTRESKKVAKEPPCISFSAADSIASVGAMKRKEKSAQSTFHTEIGSNFMKAGDVLMACDTGMVLAFIFDHLFILQSLILKSYIYMRVDLLCCFNEVCVG